MRGLNRADQSIVDADELKLDLQKISRDWDALSVEEKIAANARRGNSPPERAGSIVYKLWRKHDGVINPSLHRGMSEMKFIDVSLPKEQQVEFPISDFTKRKYA